MTPLDKLVRVRNLMQNMDLDSKLQRAYKDFESSLDPARETEVFESLRTWLTPAKDALDNYKSQYQNAIDHVNQLIQQQVPVALEKSRQIDLESSHDSNETILVRKLSVSDELHTWFAHRLHVLSSWQTPALVLRPSAEWLNDLVSNDPLYLVDKNYELLKPCQAGYHEVYRRRLREYIIDDTQDSFLTHQLPLAQFGLVFAWNYFEMRTVDVLAKYVAQVAQLLRPGGHFVFTYNNCDHENGIRLIDHYSGTYIDLALIKQIADQHDLLVSNYQGRSNIAWIELKRPGEIASLRGGQNLAKIVAKSK
jgi:SAM-dependent methyltransferase